MSSPLSQRIITRWSKVSKQILKLKGNTMKSLLAMLVLLTSVTLTLAADPDYATGAIQTSGGQPLAGVKLTFTSSQINRVVTSDANGNYRFTGQCFVIEPFDSIFTLTPVLANYTFSPSSATIFVIPCGTTSVQNFIGTLGSITSSPIDTPEFFVRQQYVDLLKREPDEGGLNFWSGGLRNCTTQACRNAERRNVMCAFIASGDYQARFTGSNITVCQ